MIIDASIGVKWLVPEKDSEAAVNLATLGPHHVPRLFFSEVGNALLKKARKGEIDLAGVRSGFADLTQIVAVADETEMMPRALELADRLGHSIYDCVYLAMAEKRDELLVTADVRFLARLAGRPEARLAHSLGDVLGSTA